jgi:hypothetical protein
VPKRSSRAHAQPQQAQPANASSEASPTRPLVPLLPPVPLELVPPSAVGVGSVVLFVQATAASAATAIPSTTTV